MFYIKKNCDLGLDINTVSKPNTSKDLTLFRTGVKRLLYFPIVHVHFSNILKV